MILYWNAAVTLREQEVLEAEVMKADCGSVQRDDGKQKERLVKDPQEVVEETLTAAVFK